MGCPSLEEPNLQSTPHWWQLCAGMGLQDVTQHPETELLWSTNADAKNPRTQNSPKMQEGPDSSSLRLRKPSGAPCGQGYALSLFERRPMVRSDGEVSHLHPVLGGQNRIFQLTENNVGHLEKVFSNVRQERTR